ncbi:MAG: 3',5'-cyclic-nucleotide phosphodiesterase, partial [Comamonadaceae bacterium]
MKVRVLGCSGAIAKDCRTTSFLVGDDVLVDAGTGVGDLTLDEMRRVR